MYNKEILAKIKQIKDLLDDTADHDLLPEIDQALDNLYECANVAERVVNEYI